MNEISDRDLAILDDVLRYRLTTVELARARHFGDASDDAARKALDKLAAEKWLRKIPLHGATRAYILAFIATQRLGIHRVAAKVPGLGALTRAYGLACYAARAGVEKLTPSEWREQFPELHRDGPPAGCYFLESERGEPKVVHVHVDTGPNVRRIVPKIRRVVRARYALPLFAELIQERRFEIAIACPSEGKKLALEKALAKGFDGITPIRLVVIEELQPLLARRLGERGRR
jgi:hypothetical protein